MSDKLRRITSFRLFDKEHQVEQHGTKASGHHGTMASGNDFVRWACGRETPSVFCQRRTVLEKLRRFQLFALVENNTQLSNVGVFARLRAEERR